MKIPLPLQEGLFYAYPGSIPTRGENTNTVPISAKIIIISLLKRQLKRVVFRLICISNEQRNSPLAMLNEAFDLAPGEVAADRYDPADDAHQNATPASAAAVAQWEANPWF
jgi:hypothetical protein